MNYIIKKYRKKYTVVDFNPKEGYTFTPNKKLNIKKIVIYEQKLIEDILKIKYNTKFKKIAKMIFKINNDEDPNADDVLMVLGDISRLKGIILNRYDKHLRLTVKKNMLNKIKLLELQLKNKLLNYTIAEEVYENEKSRSK